jgi:small-conductance mechanosensitive channel
MGQKLALLVTAGLTVFVLGVGGVLAVNLSRSQRAESATATATTIAPVSGTADPTVDDLLARERLYQERLEQANRTIEQANAQIAGLQAGQGQLQSQNQTLLQREAAYRQQLAIANSLLQQQPSAPATTVPAQPNTAPAPAPSHRDDGERETTPQGDEAHEVEENDD